MKTYRELRDFLNTLPDEDLDSPIVFEEYDDDPCTVRLAVASIENFPDAKDVAAFTPTENENPVRFVLQVTWR